MVNNSTIVNILLDRSLSQPQEIAYTFLADGENESGSCTYAELDLQAKGIAVQLLTKVNPGDRALLVYPYTAGLEFIASFLGCLYAGVVAVTDYPRQHIKSLNQYQDRIIDCQAAIALTTQEFVDRVKGQLISHPGMALKLKALPWIATDKVDLNLADKWQLPDINQDTLAYLQYTSGSTGQPKGVMITHGNIIHNSEVIYQSFGHHDDTRILMWLPMFHDMGLIGGVMQPLYAGLPAVLMSPIALAQKPFLWLQAISKYKITTSGGPNFAYDLLCQKVTDEQKASLDLSSWQVAFSGAEPVRAETLEKFAELYRPCGFQKEAFYPCYGMAEATLFVTGIDASEYPTITYLDRKALTQDKIITVAADHPDAKAAVSCGHTWLGDEVMIVDPETKVECADDRVGEIWTRGKGIGVGYWQREEQTESTFKATLADNPAKTYLRTGDLGFIKNQELYITGRIKDMMILWGRNHYPQHIEETVETCHPALRPNHGAAFSVEVGGEEQLVIAHEINRTDLRKLNGEEVIGAIRLAVGEQNLANVFAVALLKTGSIPKTSSGKIQRRACQSMFLDGSLNTVAQWQQSEIPETDITDLAGQFFSE
ncbi:fatty acyl-AMP ligase [Waterburya agarophytonicola K14]|uniref:Fatty acyl-AMP ligase n=1 Tax=Waterburya agarophytonicola KI4 TaxID=2874699 RepID=A0A964BMG6_9CYAN|nr:fatty acyl-AMP ligase [Waterburya agarophytonicola]MCC0176194.1 fatty acyl-AMP ligase [Waterburya agarophytonicola KI4]